MMTKLSKLECAIIKLPSCWWMDGYWGGCNVCNSGDDHLRPEEVIHEDDCPVPVILQWQHDNG